MDPDLEVAPPTDESDPMRDPAWSPPTAPPAAPISDDSLVNAKQGLADAVETLVAVLGSPEFRGSIHSTDRANLAKYL